MSTWRHSRDEWDQAFPVFRALLLPCIILNANQRTKTGGGLGTRLLFCTFLKLALLQVYEHDHSSWSHRISEHPKDSHRRWRGLWKSMSLRSSHLNWGKQGYHPSDTSRTTTPVILQTLLMVKHLPLFNPSAYLCCWEPKWTNPQALSSPPLPKGILLKCVSGAIENFSRMFVGYTFFLIKPNHTPTINTVERFRLLQAYLGRLSCIPFVCVSRNDYNSNRV